MLPATRTPTGTPKVPDALISWRITSNWSGHLGFVFSVAPQRRRQDTDEQTSGRRLHLLPDRVRGRAAAETWAKMPRWKIRPKGSVPCSAVRPQQARTDHCFDWATAEVRQRQGAVPQAKLPDKNGRHTVQTCFILKPKNTISDMCMCELISDKFDMFRQWIPLFHASINKFFWSCFRQCKVSYRCVTWWCIHVFLH